MKIAHLVPSSGRMACENCLRDAVLDRALRALGHELVAVPLYLPPAGEAVSPGAPVFFGGVRVYLTERHRLFRRLPRWLERALDSPRLLGFAARFAGMTQAQDLAGPALSMLVGEHGRQAGQLEELVSWLERERPPDSVLLSTALLAGLARRLKERLGSAVVCMLQDEDAWLDAMPEPARGVVWRTLAERARDVDLFVAVSHYFADAMTRRLRLPAGRVRVVLPGVDPEEFARAASPPEPPVVGYLSPFARARGFGDLVEAFVALKRDPAFADLRLRAAGQEVPGDATLADARRRLAAEGLARDVELLPDPSGPARAEFLRGLTILSVPSREPEAFGIHLLEALASGVPVVQPRRGPFPEIVELTGGGVLFEPGDAGALASALGRLLSDPADARELGRRGRGAVVERFGSERMAREMVDALNEAIAARTGAQGHFRKPFGGAFRRER